MRIIPELFIFALLLVLVWWVKCSISVGKQLYEVFKKAILSIFCWTCSDRRLKDRLQLFSLLNQLFIWSEDDSNEFSAHWLAICSNLVPSTINKPAPSVKKKKVLAKYLPLCDPIWSSVFSVCISMTHGQCQNGGTCVPDELSPDKTPAEEKRQQRGLVWMGAGWRMEQTQTHCWFTHELWLQYLHTSHSSAGSLIAADSFLFVFRFLTVHKVTPLRWKRDDCYSLAYYLNFI